MSLRDVEVTLGKQELKQRENETFFITGIEEVKTQNGTRWKISVEDATNSAFVVFVSTREIQKLIKAYGRDEKKMIGKEIRFKVVPIKIMGQDKEMIEIVL